MQKYELLADIVFAAKTDQLPQSAVESYPDLLPELDFCVTVSDVQYGIVRPSTELLGAIYIKAQREFHFDWTDSWKELSGFILRILEHFDSTHRGLIEDDLIQYIVSDKRIDNILFDNFSHPEIVGERNERVYYTVVLQNLYKWKIADEAMLQTIRKVATDKRINWLKTLYQASAVDHREAFGLAKRLIENGVPLSDNEIFKCILCGIASHDISQYLSFFEGVIKVSNLKWMALHAFGYAKSQPIESLEQVLDLIDLNPVNDAKDQCGLCFTYLCYVTPLSKEGDLYQRARANLMLLAAYENVEVLDCLIDNLYLGAQPSDIVYSILNKIIENPAHRREYYEVAHQSVGRFDAILAFEQGDECLFFDFLE